MLLTSFAVISLSLSSVNKLPPINNKYVCSFNIPLVGKQNIEYERVSKRLSEIRLTGKINKNGYIYLNLNNPTKYEIGDSLKNILKKYKCSLTSPSYDIEKDIILIGININIIRYSKNLILKNIYCNNTLL